ncbi:MAG: TetM/TetW/TetO/TetS family tetracycline resistance ribosomal protection protein [Oscillospiraceae bacterium]
MSGEKKRLVVGILAHVDAGKTTLSEALLYRAGDLGTLGRVDHGDAFLDTASLERARGITIFAKQAVLTRGDTVVTLLDTPGHVDFSAEMERTLSVLDCAILVIGGGVQSHTETLWQLLKSRKIPTFLFVNKMDLAGADRQKMLGELVSRLDSACTDFTPDDALPERLALCGETLMDQFFAAGAVTDAAVGDLVASCGLYPCYFGSALKLEGIDPLLDGLDRYLAPRQYPTEFSAKVFKIARDDQENRLTYLKITGGTLPVRTQLGGTDRRGEPWQEKVTQIRLYSGKKFQQVDVAVPGMVCCVVGLTKTYPGQGLGAADEGVKPTLEPVLRYRVLLSEGQDTHLVLTKLRILEEEDPQLRVTWDPRLEEIGVGLMGEVQREVLQELMAERFQIPIAFGPGSIVYGETLAEPVEGVGHFEPLRHYAEVHLLLEPLPRGSGLELASACSTDVLDRSWQSLVLTHLREKTHLGVLTGSPITDLKITLMSGKAHEKHTEGGDFREATYRAVRQGLRSGKSVLLEPFYAFRLELPPECLGRAMGDLQRKNGEFTREESGKAAAVLTGSVAVAALGDYQKEVAAYTHGAGRLSYRFAEYRPCANAPEVIAAADYDVDGDLEQTADSVFCAHGAGVLVRWDQVPQRMHLPSVLPPPRVDQPPDRQKIAARAPSYCAALAEDKELMAIYERTYGPIRRDPRAAFRPAQTAAEKPYADARPAPVGPEYLLVDGYNVIFAWDDLAALAAESLDLARNRLIGMLCNYQGFRQCQVILVFDAYKVKANPGTVEQVHNITVVYTKEAETADLYIEKTAHQMGKDHRVRVVTSDGLEQMIILGHGALRVPSRLFRQELDEIEKAIRSYF